MSIPRKAISPDKIPQELGKVFDLRWYAEHMLLVKEHLDVLREFLLPPNSLFLRLLEQHRNNAQVYDNIRTGDIVYPTTTFLNNIVIYTKSLEFRLHPEPYTGGKPYMLGITVHVTAYMKCGLAVHLYKTVWYDRGEDETTVRVYGEVIKI